MNYESLFTIKLIQMDITTTKLAIHNLKLKSGRPEDLVMESDYLKHKLQELELELSINN